MRRVEALRDGNWVFVGGINNLHKNDIFRMFERTGERVFDANGCAVFYAIGEPYWSDEWDTWMIDVSESPLH